MAGAATTKPHLVYIDGLRGIAAIMVMLIHSRWWVWPQKPGQPDPWWVHSWTQGLFAGHQSVDLFIVISGFCLFLPVAKRGEIPGGAINFYKRRVRRILPTYYIALFLSFLMFCLSFHVSLQQLIQKHSSSILSDLFLLCDFFPNDINNVFWSVAVECKIYIVFPLLVYSWYKFGPGISIALSALAGYSLLGLTYNRSSYLACPHYLFLFTLGMLGAWLTETGRALKTPAWAWLMAAIALTIPVRLYYGINGQENEQFQWWWMDLLVGMASMFFLIAGRSEGRFQKILSFRPLTFVGTFAYSLYLLHITIFRIPVWPFNAASGFSDLQKIIAYPLLGCAVIMVSYLFYLLFERPFAKARTRINVEGVG